MQMKSRSSYAVRVRDQPVHDTHDPTDVEWKEAGGNPRDEGRYAELISRRLTGSEALLFGIAWLEPGETHILHHHPTTEEFYYVIEGTATFRDHHRTNEGGPASASK